MKKILVVGHITFRQKMIVKRFLMKNFTKAIKHFHIIKLFSNVAAVLKQHTLFLSWIDDEKDFSHLPSKKSGCLTKYELEKERYKPQHELEKVQTAT